MKCTKKNILINGILGSLGAFLIVLVDITYNVFHGNEVGNNLYFTFLGLFLFPLWWAGIWVVYQGLKPAGVFWSLIPCLIFAYYTSTVNVFYHSCYPFWAVIHFNQLNNSDSQIPALMNNMSSTIHNYTHIVNHIDDFLQVVICIWISIPILRGKTHFPKWFVLFIPIVPMILSILINLIFKRFLTVTAPYIACGFIFILFVLCTCHLYRNYKVNIN